MVHFTWSEKNSSTWQWPEPETTSLSGEKHPMKLEDIGEELPLHKRWKPTSYQATNESSLDSNESLTPPQYDPLNEPSPLGLRLKKSPSLLDLIQTKLSQSNKNNGVLPSENLNKKDVKARVGTSGSIDKLKASNFPALLLRIGQWEYVSQHEGDLVAKCYFAKHKLVWEILDGGLKNKIEIQWADIVSLKANCPDNGPGTLTIVLVKQPLFFRETNPQPRKHTLWQATSDFTNGEASKYRQHYLQCALGVLNKHYEKLIQCDTRLNFLSQKTDTVSDVPFVAEALIKDPNISGNNGSNQLETPKGSSVDEMGALQHGDFTKDARANGSVMSIHAFEDRIEQFNTPPKLQPAMSISELVNHIGHCISEQKSSGHLPFFENVSFQDNQKDMLDNISQILLSDTQLTTDSDENTLMSRVDSLCCLLQTDVGNDGNDYSTPDREQVSGMSRKDSFNDLVHQLPRIVSLPRFLFDISEDGEILNP